MAEPHLDHPDEISWFNGYSPLPTIGVCPHVDCQHWGASVVAWGPDRYHYQLVECMQCLCRGWWGEWNDAQGMRHYRVPVSWLELDRTVVVVT